jgi:hypothetical protein
MRKAFIFSKKMPTFAENFRLMNTLRTLVASLLLVLGATAALADDYQYLTISQNDGETSYTVSSIRKITFDATNMVLHLSDGSEQSLPLADLSKMFFSKDGSGVSLTPMQSKMHFSGGVLRTNIAAGEHVAIYNMKGEKVFSANESGTFDLTTLTKGVYIVKVGTETRKVVNK